MSERPRRYPVVPTDRFTKGILSDLSRQRDREQLDRAASAGGMLSGSHGQSQFPWTSVIEAVSVCTRRLRETGYYPETVLAAVKSGVRDAVVSLVPEPAAENVVREAAQACIAAYFDVTPGALTPDRPAWPSVSIPQGASTPGASCSMVREAERGERSSRARSGFARGEL